MENKISEEMTKQTKKKIQHIIRMHQKPSTMGTEQLRHVAINGIDLFYTDVDFSLHHVRFRRVMQLPGEINVTHTVAIIYYDEIKSIHVNGRRCIYD